MHQHTEKPKENKTTTPTNSVTQNKRNERSDFGFIDNRPQAIAQRKIHGMIHNSQPVSQLMAFQDMANNSPVKQYKKESSELIQLKKDKAVHDFGDKGDGKTSTKVIDQKVGGRGLFRYQYKDEGNVIDSFNGTNIANNNIANGTPYAGIAVPNITVKVASHDLTKKYGDTEALSDHVVANGTRGDHFAHADSAHGIDRTDKYTWHHKQDKGKMELIDMNAHGAMWHYGGIAGWGASLHSGDSSEDD